MDKVSYFLICENFNHDSVGRVTLFNVFTDVNSTENIARPPRFVLAIGVTPQKAELIDNTKIKFKIEILDEDNKLVKKIESKEQEVPTDKIGKATIVAPVDLSGQLEFKKDGVHTVNLYISDNEPFATTHFKVNLNKPKGSNDIT